jgi:hypothetical protein
VELLSAEHVGAVVVTVATAAAAVRWPARRPLAVVIGAAYVV